MFPRSYWSVSYFSPVYFPNGTTLPPVVGASSGGFLLCIVYTSGLALEIAYTPGLAREVTYTPGVANEDLFV